MALRLLVVVAVIGLAARLWQLQMAQGDSYRVLADRNRFRQVDVAAPRGVIYDRNGYILARNRPNFTIAVVPADLPKTAEGELDEAAQTRVLDELFALLERPAPVALATPGPTPTTQAADTTKPEKNSRIFPMNKPKAPLIAIPDRQPWLQTRERVEAAIADGLLGGAFRPITIATNIPEATAFLIAEDIANLPGIEVLPQPIRDYPTGPLTAHTIGYMGHIPEKRVAEYQAQGYGVNDQVGLTGLEATFEQELRGKPGHQIIEVDVNGRKVRTIGQPELTQPGHNLVLTLDMELQQAATEALQDVLDKSRGFTKATQGVVIALNPRSGAVLALVSLPSHDNNIFAKGITGEAWNALVKDPALPMFDQAIGGQYPPGSTFKIIMASAGLQEGVINTRTLLGDGFDGKNDGIIWLPNEYLPWDRTRDQPFYSWIHKYGQGHGFVAVRDALAVSDDIFFYQLGGGYLDVFRGGLGVEAIGYYAQEFGLGAATGIELPDEAEGGVPDPKWKRLTYAERWLTGDTYNMSIGQGFVLATPLQVANATTVVANHGSLYRPQLVDHITDAEGRTTRPFQPSLIREVRVDAGNLDIVREGMFGAVNWPQGTAPLARVARHRSGRKDRNRRIRARR